MSVPDYQALLSKTINDGLKQISGTIAESSNQSPSIEQKTKTDAQKAAAKRKKDNYRNKQKLKKTEDNAAKT